MLDYIELQVEYFPELDKKSSFLYQFKNKAFSLKNCQNSKKQSALEKGIDSETALAYHLYHKEMQTSTKYMISKKKG